MNLQRTRTLKEGQKKTGPIVYWMSRDQRVDDNWALLHAQEVAISKKEPLVVVFCLSPHFLGATKRQYKFMLQGLTEVEAQLKTLNLPFKLLIGEPVTTLLHFLALINASVIITDFDPLRIKQQWKERLSSALTIPFYEVDAHNIVPCWVASQKREYGAYTLRPKIHRLLHQYLEDFPPLKKHPFTMTTTYALTDWNHIENCLNVDTSVSEVSWLKPGYAAGTTQLESFLNKTFSNYSSERNNPVKNAQSHLSPYLHFGQLSAQRIALTIYHISPVTPSTEAFLEELIVRRELSDNFCYYNPHYDQFSGFPSWAQETLNTHRHDPRPYLYSLIQLENAATHDELWNAAQKEMVCQGKMHGYLRMYWAKKILEWTPSPEEALATAIYLNDKYQLDGRDPNGYTGVAWSIGGVHDRAWNQRSVFGKIRYMSYNGMKAKFSIKDFIKKTTLSLF